ncbi:MAG: substrate-binding domain-containing protein, partial [Propionibacteriaceae bacterium]|nr:substrate-binding domain-containing protein [Propionibacteriaceae bacterium]
GLEPGPCLRGDWLPASGYAAGRQLLADGDLPTAVFVANDQMCQGLLRAFAETGVRCPDDVSLVGFDDFLGTDQYTPPLTTVRQDFSLLGEVCVEMLLAQISGGPTPARSLVPELVIRKSTAPPR